MFQIFLCYIRMKVIMQMSMQVLMIKCLIKDSSTIFLCCLVLTICCMKCSKPDITCWWYIYVCCLKIFLELDNFQTCNAKLSPNHNTRKDLRMKKVITEVYIIAKFSTQDIFYKVFNNDWLIGRNYKINLYKYLNKKMADVIVHSYILWPHFDTTFQKNGWYRLITKDVLHSCVKTPCVLPILSICLKGTIQGFN